MSRCPEFERWCADRHRHQNYTTRHEIEVAGARQNAALEERAACERELERLIQVGVLVHRDKVHETLNALIAKARELAEAANAISTSSSQCDWSRLEVAALAVLDAIGGGEP